MDYQNKLPFAGIDDELDAVGRIRTERRLALLAAMRKLDFDPSLTVWRLCYLVLTVTATSDGILRRTAPDIAKDKAVNRTARSVRQAIIDAETAGILTAEPWHPKRSGRPSKQLAINWPAVFAIADGRTPPNSTGKRTGKQTGKRTGKQTGKTQNAHILDTNTNTTTKETETGGGGELELKQLFESVGLQRSATLAAEFGRLSLSAVRSAVATYKANASRFRGPGAIVDRLRAGAWPADDIVDADELAEQRERAKRIRHEREQAEREQAELIEAERRQFAELENRFGGEFEQMPAAEQKAVAEAAGVGSALVANWDHWKQKSFVKNQIFEYLQRQQICIAAQNR